jgi:hypothetical protein
MSPAVWRPAACAGRCHDHREAGAVTRTTRPDEPALGLAVRGFVDLAEWFTKLVGDQAVSVARAVAAEAGVEANAEPGAAGDPAATGGATATATGELARLGALSLLGWVGLVNETFDAAAVLTKPPRRLRDVAPDQWFPIPDDVPAGRLVAEVATPLRREVSGEVETLDSVGVEVDDENRTLRVTASDVPPERVGVFRGRVGVRVEGSDAEPRPVDVWLVVP